MPRSLQRSTTLDTFTQSLTQSINAQPDEYPSRSDHERRARNTQHDILSRFFAISRADLLLLRLACPTNKDIM